MKLKNLMTARIATPLIVGAFAISSVACGQSYGSGSAQQAPAPTATVTSYGSGAAQTAEAGLHAAWNDILGTYVSAPDNVGLTHFNYGGLKNNAADSAKLNAYISSLEAINPNTLSEDEAVPYYSNLYNAVTIKVIIDNYPVKSIRDLKSGFVPGPWGRKLITLNGKPTTLNNIEHDILRKQFPSPYVHYMVNCASVGCPNLPNFAWTPANYKAERENAAAAYINSPRGVQITSKGLKISSIFKWFKEDFGGKSGLIPHLRKHAGPELARAIDNGARVVGDDYNWDLNK